MEHLNGQQALSLRMVGRARRGMLIWQCLTAAFFTCWLTAPAAIAADERPRHVVIFVIDGFSYKAWDRLNIPILRKLAADGVLVEQDQLPPPAHPKAGAYAEVHTSSIVNPIMMAGTIFINQETVLLQQALPASIPSAFVVNSRAYVTMNRGYSEVVQQDGPDALSVERALDIMGRLKPGFMRVHLQNPGSAGFQCLTTEENVPWRGNIWASGSPYRIATERADSLLGAFVDGLRRLGLLERTALIVLGDHGQDDGGWHPLELPDGAMTSMVLWGSGIRKNVRIPYAEHIDVVPTVCALLNVQVPRTSQGRPIVEAFTFHKGPFPKRPEFLRLLNRQLAEYRTLSVRVAARLEIDTVPHRGKYYYRLGLIREAFYDLGRFTEWPKSGTIEALLEANENALKALRALVGEID